MATDRAPPPDRPAPPEKSDLEVFLRIRGPELLQKHAANILMVVLIVAAATMFLYTRSRNKVAEQAATNQNTAIAYDFAQQTRDLFNTPIFNDGLARERQAKVRDVFAAVELVLSSDAEPSQKAAALLARAEVLWQLANAPEQSLATTQPAPGFKLQPRADYLNDAEAGYTEILSKYADQKEYAANALLSLAAIAETRRDFAKAADWYAKVIADTSLRPVYREIADARTKMIAEISVPYLLATPATRPTTSPASQPEIDPASQPAATLPALP